METQQLILQLSQLQSSNFKTEDERVQTIDALQAAITRLQTPWETAFRIVYTHPSQAAALKLSHDVDLFALWHKSFPDVPARKEDLARVTGLSLDLLERMLRHLSTTQVIERTCSGQYALNEFSKALASTELKSMISFLYNTTLPGFTNLPAFLKATAYRNPDDSSNTNWHHMRGISRFDELKQNSQDMKIFQDVMALNTGKKSAFVDVFPVGKLISMYQPNNVFLVDAGGGLGHDIIKFYELLKEKVKLESGSLVLQDIAIATGDTTRISQIDTIRLMEHDFFQEQPVKGASAYYLHTVLHDWADDHAIKILKTLSLAAKPTRSRILIHEIVLTDDSSAQSTAQDMVMMMALSSRERTEAEWYRIVEAAGLEVTTVWSSAASVESVIEARVPLV